MPCFYLTPKQDEFNRIPELQVCIAEALYGAESVLSNPSPFKPEEIRTLRDQITSNLERAWEITGGTEDQLTGTMVQGGYISNPPQTHPRFVGYAPIVKPLRARNNKILS